MCRNWLGTLSEGGNCDERHRQCGNVFVFEIYEVFEVAVGLNPSEWSCSVRSKSLKELQSKEQLRELFAGFGRSFQETARWQKYVLPEDNRLPDPSLAAAEAAMAEVEGGGEGGRVGEDGMLEELVEESRSVLSR